MLHQVKDPHILAKLMFDWLDQLKVKILYFILWNLFGYYTNFANSVIRNSVSNCCYLFDYFIKTIQEPVLHAQDLPFMLEYYREPREGLKFLSQVCIVIFFR